MPVTRLLALVRPDLPRASQELRALEEQDQANYEMFVNLAQCANAIDSSRDREEKQEILLAYLHCIMDISGTQRQLSLPVIRDFRKMSALLQERVKVVRDTMRNFMKRFVPSLTFKLLFPRATGQEPLKDIITLVSRGFGGISGGSRIFFEEEQRRLRFEAQRDFILAAVNFGQIAQGRWIGYGTSAQDRVNVVSYLSHLGILQKSPVFVEVRSWHDPDDEFRARWIDDFENHSSTTRSNSYVPRVTRMSRAQLRLGQKTFDVFLKIRRKGFIQTIGKMFARGPVATGTAFERVQDRRGLCIAFRNPEELKEGAAILRESLPFNQRLGRTWEEYRDHADTPVNRHSAPNFVAVSFYRLLDGRRYQIQCRLARQHLDLLYCRGSENHTLYHLRQYLDEGGLFNWLFPQSIYEVSWRESSMYRNLKRHILQSLPQ